jgi:hypothetical protein
MGPFRLPRTALSPLSASVVLRSKAPPPLLGTGGERAVCLLHTCEAVRHSDVRAIVLSQKHTNNSFPCPFCLTAVVICCGEKHERRNRHGASHE